MLIVDVHTHIHQPHCVSSRDTTRGILYMPRTVRVSRALRFEGNRREDWSRVSPRVLWQTVPPAIGSIRIDDRGFRVRRLWWTGSTGITMEQISHLKGFSDLEIRDAGSDTVRWIGLTRRQGTRKQGTPGY